MARAGIPDRFPAAAAAPRTPARPTKRATAGCSRRLRRQPATRRRSRRGVASPRPGGAGIVPRVLGQAPDARTPSRPRSLVLAKKAAAVRNRDSVAGWLFQVAHRTAARLRWQRARRGARPSGGRPSGAGDGTGHQTATRHQADPAAEAGRSEAAAVVDEELGRLPEKYRTALVLCYLEGQTHEEAARQLGLPLGTLKTRLDRGRNALGERLKRGLALSTGGVTAVPAQLAAAAFPTALAQVTTTAAVGFAVGAARRRRPRRRRWQRRSSRAM